MTWLTLATTLEAYTIDPDVWGRDIMSHWGPAEEFDHTFAYYFVV